MQTVITKKQKHPGSNDNIFNKIDKSIRPLQQKYEIKHAKKEITPPKHDERKET